MIISSLFLIFFALCQFLFFRILVTIQYSRCPFIFINVHFIKTLIKIFFQSICFCPVFPVECPFRQRWSPCPSSFIVPDIPTSPTLGYGVTRPARQDSCWCCNMWLLQFQWGLWELWGQWELFKKRLLRGEVEHEIASLSNVFAQYSSHFSYNSHFFFSLFL